MSNPSKPVSMTPAICGTAAAIIQLVTCVCSVVGHPPLGIMIVIFLSELVLIASAVVLWVMYFRGYIVWQIEERLQKPPDKSRDISS
jgi:hypothetical protein